MMKNENKRICPYCGEYSKFLKDRKIVIDRKINKHGDVVNRTCNYKEIYWCSNCKRILEEENR